MVTLQLAVCVALSIVFSGLGVQAVEEASADVVVCKLDTSIPRWREIADQSSAIAQQATGIPKTVFSALHDSMKGSADIVTAISNVRALSREGLYQLNQNCIIAPVQVENLIGSMSAQYPDFGTRFKTQLEDIKTKAEQLSAAILKC